MISTSFQVEIEGFEIKCPKMGKRGAATGSGWYGIINRQVAAEGAKEVDELALQQG